MGIEKGWEAIRRMQAVSDEEVNSMKRLVMTTDTKAVARFYWAEDEMQDDRGGDYVLFTDHERVVGEHKEQLDKFIAEAERTFAVYETDLAALRAEVEGFRKDAERYRWLKDTPWTENRELSLVIQCQMNAIWDKTIDAAMEKGNV